MKIALPAEKNSIDAYTDERFGRAAGYIIYDSKTKNTEWIDNSTNSKSSQGAGLKAAQFIINSGAKILISYDVGPKAFEILAKTGTIAYRLENRIKIKDAISMYEENELKKFNEGE